jgi:DNA-binding transcriptional ArsR family regulator
VASLNEMVKRGDRHISAVFQALSDPTRRGIIAMLARRAYSIGELVPAFSISFVAVSNHVKVLERANLITREVRGRYHVCKLNARVLKVAYDWLGTYQHFWNERLDALEGVIEEMKKEGETR